MSRILKHFYTSPPIFQKGFIQIDMSFSKGVFTVPEADWQEFYMFNDKKTLLKAPVIISMALEKSCGENTDQRH